MTQYMSGRQQYPGPLPMGPYGGAMGPSGGAMDPYGGAMDPNGGAMDPYGGVMDPYGGAMDPYGGAMDPYGGAMNPYGGAMDPYGGAMNPYGGAMDPYGGAMNPYGGAVGPIVGAVDLIYGPVTMPPQMERGFAPEMGYEMDPGYGSDFYPMYGDMMYGSDPVYQLGAPYIDELINSGYYGPWPADYYMPPPEMAYRNRRRHDSSDEESDDDDDTNHCQHRCARKRSCQCNTNRSGNVTQGNVTQADIANLLEKFESALSVRYKKAKVVELDNENEKIKRLTKEKHQLKKQVALVKLDLLRREALAFNAGAPVPGRRPLGGSPGNQVVSIDFGE